ncbi:RNA polymerase sigma factor [Aggregatimonas sangjinii]|uniref:RNA polymerase sigma factor n=1 Tax=Aggregatimonas sangjinii TaxID=2583587 RepID=A0A5B7SNX9_9FLAO|nr:RNA polymerase sigma factor [Aggregatimonas sangjinii]QCW98730.1 RNA polymerase sigma factor [Aggregatimonas sangjinii]
MTAEETEFVRVIKENEGIIYKIARTYTKTADDRNDLYQEIVYQLWKSFPTFKGKSKIGTWLYRVAMNTSISQWRKDRRAGHRVELDHLFLRQAEGYSGEFEARLHLVYQQIDQLDEIEKGLILLFLEGKRYSEIAAITGFTASNVGTRISRIKNKMRQQLKK